MEDFRQQLDEKVSELHSLVIKFQERLSETPVSKGLRDVLTSFHDRYQTYLHGRDGEDHDKVVGSASTVATYGIATSQNAASLENLDEDARALGAAIGVLANEIKTRARDDPSNYQPLGAPPVHKIPAPASIPAAVLQRIDQFVAEQEKHDERVKISLNENERRLELLEARLQQAEEKALISLTDIDKAAQRTFSELRSKEEQIDSILGHVAGRVIAGDYGQSAEAEKSTADSLRWGALFCMAFIILLLGYSFWESVGVGFQLEKSIFRVVLAFLISAPAAYLARESSKHRAQHYQHLQTSLDLKAITPYLASLPDDVQHKIKSDVASKLFSGREPPNVNSESYPVNVQELILGLMKKLEASKTDVDGKK
ncbi:MAG: hypothetical protein V4858_01320 [Pseudomonadota bacterium]